MGHDPLYLDNAATSFPKAPGVAEAVYDSIARIGASPGRGAYAQSREAAAILRDCRAHLAELIGAADPDRIVFTLNCTDALNLAIHGMVADSRLRGTSGPLHIVTTDGDHNSILRVLTSLAPAGVDFTRVPVDARTGFVAPRDIANAIGPRTILVATQHASNVTGAIQPIAAIAHECRRAAVPLLLDAAQTLGHVPLDVVDLGVDLLAFPGHKGLLGPLGTGGLYLAPGIEQRVAPLRQGGTGSQSDSDLHPAAMPHRYEPGSHNMPGITGLAESTRWILRQGVGALRRHELDLCRRMLSHAQALAAAGYHLLGPPSHVDRVAVFSLWHPDIQAHDLAALLESDHGILTRSGLHCAPHAHQTSGTLRSGGAVRLSFGAFCTVTDVDRAASALQAVAAAAAPLHRVTPR